MSFIAVKKIIAITLVVITRGPEVVSSFFSSRYTNNEYRFIKTRDQGTSSLWLLKSLLLDGPEQGIKNNWWLSLGWKRQDNMSPLYLLVHSLLAICQRNRLTSTRSLHQTCFLDKETEAWQRMKHRLGETAFWVPVIHFAAGFLHPSSVFCSVFQGIVSSVCTELVGGRHHRFDWCGNLHLKA